MKILFTLTPAFNPNDGGVQRTTYKLGKYFTEYGFEVFYYSLANHGHVHCEYGHLSSSPEKGSDKNNKNIQHLLEHLADVQPDIVINQMPYSHGLRSALSQQKKQFNYLLLGCLRNSLFNFKSNARDRMRQMLPLSMFALMDNSLCIRLVQLHHWYKHRRDLKAIINQHDFFILLAPPNRMELEHFVGNYCKEKVVAIPNSIPQVQEQVPSKEKIILHVGRLDVQQKRSDLLLDFWAACHTQLPGWSFVIVGDGDYRETLERELQQRKLPNISIEGYQKPEPYYAKAAIFMMPSAYEGFPNTILEAQSYGCAVLAFDSYAALRWIVNDGKDAVCIPAFDTILMAQKAISIATDSQRLFSIQQKALSNAQKFTINTVGKIWLDFFNQHLNV